MSYSFDFYGEEITIDSNQVAFNGEIVQGGLVRTRKVSDLADVWMEESISGNETVYTTYLGIIKNEDKDLFRRLSIEHGIVVMLPGLYGAEYPKLYGHYHEVEGELKKPSPELHTVLSGQGHFFLQKSIPPYKNCEDAILVDARKGDAFIIPPFYGHTVINPSNEPLIYNGFFNSKMSANYEVYKKFRGAAYYEILDKESESNFIPNPNYLKVPPLRFFSASELPLQKEYKGIKSWYQAIKNNPELFDFISDPEKFKSTWFY